MTPNDTPIPSSIPSAEASEPVAGRCAEASGSALVARVREYAVDHAPDGWPAVRMSELTALADRIESLDVEVRERRKDAHRHASAVRLLRDLLARVGADDHERIYAVLEDLDCLPNTNVQRRSGEEPASPSVLKPTDQPPTPERSM